MSLFAHFKDNLHMFGFSKMLIVLKKSTILTNFHKNCSQIAVISHVCSKERDKFDMKTYNVSASRDVYF